MPEKINIAEKFSSRLVYRDKFQGDGLFNALDFREKFLQDLENDAWWKDASSYIELDFSGVKTLGPSWANEVFAYYTSRHKPEVILKKIKLVDISKVKKSIVEMEIESGYTKK